MAHQRLALALRRLLPALREAAARFRAQTARGAGVVAFALLFLPHLMGDPLAPFHSELERELTAALEHGGRLVGALPREHGKTTLGTVALVLRELCIGDKRNILLIGANQREAEAKLRLITTELERGVRFPAAWRRRLSPARDGHGRQVAYGDSEIVLAGGQRVAALGFGGKVRGQLTDGLRPDLVVLDDPEDDAGVESPEVRLRQRRWCDLALLNALDSRTGSLVWLGTLLHHDAVLAQWLGAHAGRPGWRTLTRAALDGAGNPLWPGRWNRERLKRREAEIGAAAFAQEFMNRPLSTAGQVFRPGDFGSYDPQALSRTADGWQLDGAPLTVVAGVDPAIGQGAHHDNFAACVLGLRRDADTGALRCYVLELAVLKARFADQLARLKALHREWQPRLIGIEAVAYQAALAQEALSAGLPAIALSDTRPKALRIEAAAVQAAHGALLLPTAGAWVAEFRSEALAYPAGRHDDQLDALARALETGLPLIRPAGLITTAREDGSRRRGLADGF